MTARMDVARLEQIAQQLAGRVRDDDPAANARWLHAVTAPEDREALLYVLAAAVPVDVPWRVLTAWAGGLEPVPVTTTQRAPGRRGTVTFNGSCAECGGPFNGGARRRFCSEPCRRRHQRSLRAVPDEEVA